jgi:hypothetical protein
MENPKRYITLKTNIKRRRCNKTFEDLIDIIIKRTETNKTNFYKQIITKSNEFYNVKVSKNEISKLEFVQKKHHEISINSAKIIICIFDIILNYRDKFSSIGNYINHRELIKVYTHFLMGYMYEIITNADTRNINEDTVDMFQHLTNELEIIEQETKYYNMGKIIEELSSFNVSKDGRIHYNNIQ